MARDLARTARLFHGLSDQTRLEILDRLRGGERCVCELTDALGAAQSRLSFHLRTLRDAGLIEGRREGRWSYYRIRPDAMGEIRDLLESLESDAATVAAA